MSAPPDRTSPAPPLDVDAISARTFGSAFRGWDPDEVRVHLVQVAEGVRVLQLQYAELERRLVEAEAAARRANTSELDVAEVSKVLGEETARVLQTARDAAAEIREKAEERVAGLTRQASDDAADIRARAEAEGAEIRRLAEEEAEATRATGEAFVADLQRSVEQELDVRREAAEAEVAEQRQAAREETALQRAEADEDAARAREEAETAADRIRVDADTYATSVRTSADEYSERVRIDADALAELRLAEADTEATTVRTDAESAAAELRSTAAAELEEAQARARHQVEEAEVVRERVLADLSKRRKAARQHLEQLWAARERLLAAYEVVRGTVDEATREMTVVLPEAKLASDEAARRVAGEPEVTIEQLEAELSMARDADLPLVAGVGVGELDSPVDMELEDEGGDEAEVVAAEVEEAAATEGGDVGVEGPDTAAPTELNGAAAADDAADEPGPASPAVVATTPEVTSPEHVLDLRATAEARARKSGRLFRRRDPLGGAQLPDAPLEPVDAPAPFEDVRVIGSAAEAAPRPPVDPPALAARRKPATPPAEETAVEAAADTEPDIDEAGIEAEAEAASEPPAAQVDDIFARIRAGQAEQEGDNAPTDQVPVVAALRAVEAESEAAETAAEEAPEKTGGAKKAAKAKKDGKAEKADDEAAEPTPESIELSLLEKRDGVVAEVEARLAKRMKRVLSDEQSSLLDEVRRSRRKPTAEQVLPGVDEQRLLYVEAATEELRAAVIAGVRFAGDLDDRSVVTTATKVDDIAEALAEQLAGPLRARVERALLDDPDGDGDGGATAADELELADRIRSCYREWRNQRVGEAVADATIAAFTRGLYEALPSECELRWVVDSGPTPCPDADDNALAGALAKGEAFPTGHVCPPAHAGCRCLIVPVHQ
jgi:hypothetical protein